MISNKLIEIKILSFFVVVAIPRKRLMTQAAVRVRV